MSLKKTNAKEGLLGSRKTTAALACVLALAMVVCAFAVTAPSDNGADAAPSPIPTTGVTTVEDGDSIVAVGGTTYVVSGNVSFELLGAQPIDSTEVKEVNIYLLKGASVHFTKAVNPTGDTAVDTVNILPEVRDDFINEDIAIEILTDAESAADFTIAFDGYGSATIAVNDSGTAHTVLGKIDNTSVANGASIGINATEDVLSLSGTAHYIEDSSAVPGNIGYALSAVTTGGNNVIYGEDAISDDIEVIDNTAYTVVTTSTNGVSFEYTYGDAGSEQTSVIKLVKNSTATENMTLVTDEDGAITFTGCVDESEYGTVTAVFGQFTSTTQITTFSGAAISYDGSANYTYYALAPEEFSITGSAEYTLFNGTTVVTAGTNTVTLTDIVAEGGMTLSGTDAVEINVDDYTGSISLGEGTSVTSTGPVPLDIPYDYATRTGSAGEYSFTYETGAISSASSGTYYIVKNVTNESDVTFGTDNAVVLPAGYNSNAPVEIDYASGGTISIAGTIAADYTVKISAGTVTVADQTTLINNGIIEVTGTLSVAGTLTNNNSIVAATEEEGAKTLTITGTITGNMPGMAFTVADLTSIGFDYVFATKSDSAYTIYTTVEDGIVINTTVTEVVVKAVPAGTESLTITVGTDASAGTVTFAPGFASVGTAVTDYVTMTSTGVKGSYIGGMTLNNVDIAGNLTVGVNASAAGTTPVVEAQAGTLNIQGTVTVTGTNILTINDEAEVNIDGTLDVTQRVNIVSTGIVYLTDASNVKMGAATLIGTGGIEFEDGAEATLTEIKENKGFTLDVTTGTVTATALGIGEYTTINVMSGATVIVDVSAEAKILPTEGTIVNDGIVKIVAGSTVNNTGTFTNNGIVEIAGAYTGPIVNNGTVNVTNADAIAAVNGISAITGTNAYVGGEGWDYTVTGTNYTLTIDGAVTENYFKFQKTTTVVVGANASVTTVNNNAFDMNGQTVTFQSVAGQDNTLTIDTTGTEVNAIAGDTGTATILADVTITNGGINVATLNIGSADSSVYVDVVGGITTTVGTVTNSGIVSVGAINYTTSFTVDGANISITLGEDDLFGFEVKSGYDDGTSAGAENTAAASSIITEGLKFTGVDTTNVVNTMFIANGGNISYTDGEGYLIVMDGLATAPSAGNIYMYNGADVVGNNVLPRSVTNAIAPGATVYNILALALADDGSNVVFVSASSVNLDGLEIDKDMTIATGAHGAVTVAEDVTLTIGGAYTEADATVNGVLSVTGALTGKVNGIAFNGVSGVLYTAGAAAENDTIGMTDKAVASGTVTIPAEVSVTIAKGTVIKGVAVNGVTLNITAVIDLNVAGVEIPAEEETSAEDASSAGEATAAPAAARVAAMSVPTENPEGETVETGLTITGDIQLDGPIAGVGGLTIEDADITAAEGVKNAQITIGATETLTLDGAIVLGEGVTIIVQGTLVIGDNADISGAEDSIVIAGGNIVGDSDRIADGVVTVEDNASIVVKTEKDFTSALPYYDTIIVQGEIKLDSTKDEPKTYNADTVDIILNHGKLIIGENVTLIFNEANVTINDELSVTGYPADTSVVSGIEVTGIPADKENNTPAQMGSIQVNNSDIYVDVVVVEGQGQVLPGTGNTMTVSGTSTGLDKIGFGNTLIVNADFTLGNRTGDLLVYGTVQVNADVTLSISQGTTMTVSKSGVLNAAGTIDSAGTIIVNGTANVDGALTVQQNGVVYGSTDGAVNVTGTLDVNGTVAAHVVDKGTVTINGNVEYTVAGTPAQNYNAYVTIYDGAALNIEKAVGTMTVTDKDTVTAYENDKIDFTPAQDGNSITLTDSVGYVIETSVEQRQVTVQDDKGKDVKVTYDYAVMSVSGANVEGDVTVAPATGFAVSGDLSIAEGDLLLKAMAADSNIPDEKEQVTQVVIAGNIAVAVGATFTNEADLVITGSVDISAATAANAVIKNQNGGDVTATYYDVSTAASGDVAAYVTKTYTTFDNAIAAIAGADKTTVTVSGEQTATVTVDVTGTVYVPAGDKLTVAEGTTLTFTAQGYLLNNNAASADKMVVVEGTMVFANYPNYTEAATANTSTVAEPNIDADVVIIETPARTFTTLANAIAMGETDITLNQTVVLTEDLTIPAGVTVRGEDKNIEIAEEGVTENDVELTVEGAVQLTGTGVINQNAGAPIEGVAADAEKKNYEGTLVVSGMGYVYTQSYLGFIDVAGAYYQKYVDHDADEDTQEILVNVVSTVDYAADDSANVYVDAATETATITIRGEAAGTDVTFAVPVDEDTEEAYALQIDVVGDLTVDSMTIVPGVTIDVAATGSITGSVASDVGTVDMDGVEGITIESVAAVEDEEDPVPAMLTISGTVTGDVTISAGTVTILTSLTIQEDAVEQNQTGSSSLTVASGVTLDVDGTLTVGNGNDANANEKEDVSAEIAGTMDVAGAAIFYGEATVTGTVADKGYVGFANVDVDGTITVEGTESTTAGVEDTYAVFEIADGTVTGTIDANEYSDVKLGVITVTGTVNAAGKLALIGIVTVGDLGTGAYELGTALAGEINVTAPEGEEADVVLTGLEYIKAYNGTTVSGLGDAVVSTAYYINGTLYMTVYAPEDTTETVFDVALAETYNLTENGLALDTGLKYQGDLGTSSETRNSGLYKAAEWYKTSNMLPNSVMTGSEVIGATGSTAVYATVEPVPVTVSVTVTNGLTLYLDGQPVNSGSMDLAVGEHTVFIQPQAGYKADNATISFAGQTVVTGTGQATITLTADMENAVLFATGAEQSGTQIIVPENPSQEPPVVNVTTGDNEMSLTDYLLIVLVVLIVIMAIIVALRLMRN